MGNPFIDHPRSVGESYLEHAGFALRVAARCFAIGAVALVHALLPFLFQTTAREMLFRLVDELKAPRRPR